MDVTELDALVLDDRGLKLLSPEVFNCCPRNILAPGGKASFSLGISPNSCVVAGFDALPPSDYRHASKYMGEYDLAYIMLTSGTTDTPKGVMVSTGNVSSFLSAMQGLYPFTHQDRVSRRHELSFDFSVLDLFIAWVSGASLHVIPASQLAGPSQFIRERELTVWFSVPSTVAFM